ncbi:hypothetical protein BS47DRAFT_1396676 [Hydnum rufescens UP504]|uniref:Uncharacterized protein n=1 Tax=Hydnum rufescens UP504 TaxID=1448309 RepID=A0A9P6AQJ7_9AGAM|nr:hypothetical protein BS47DRAFT_1396676 [Hydnum rufescens UP504]
MGNLSSTPTSQRKTELSWSESLQIPCRTAHPLKLPSLSLKLQRDKLKQYQKKATIARESLAAGNRTRALTALRHRKYQKVYSSRPIRNLKHFTTLQVRRAPLVIYAFLIPVQVSTIEFSLVEKDIMYGLKQGNQVLTEIHKEMTLDGVEKLMEETAGPSSTRRSEISQILESRMTHDEEDAVQRELETMEGEVAPVSARVLTDICDF